MATTDASKPAPETPAQWWARVRAEHGPPPQHLRDLYAGIRTRHAQQHAQASPSTARGTS